MSLTDEQREYIRQEIRRRALTVICPGCGVEVPKTSRNRRYCTVACANRHWHVRNAPSEPVPQQTEEGELWVVQSETDIGGGLAYWGPYDDEAEAQKMAATCTCAALVRIPCPVEQQTEEGR